MCVSEGGDIVFMSLYSALPLDEIAQKFDIMSRECANDLFSSSWKTHMKKAASSVTGQKAQELVIEDIKTKIWDPTFAECNALLNSLHDRSIKLADIDSYFSLIEDNNEMQLHRLHNGIMKCMGVTQKPNLQWIQTTVKLMEEYWSLVKLADAAKMVMTLKYKLGLSGDFNLIQTIAEEVSLFPPTLPLNL